MRTSFILIAITLIACTTPPKQKAEKTVKEYLNKTLNDASSYQSVDTKLDSFYATYEETKAYSQIMDSLKYIHNKFREDQSLLSEDFDNYFNTTRSLLDTINKRAERFKPVFFGWMVEHKYRAKNGFGALILKTDTFYLNRDFQIMRRDTIQL